MKCVRCIAMLLIVIGALNWGLVGFFQYNLIADIFGGEDATGARVVFALVGLAGLLGITMLCCRSCRCNSSCSCCKKKEK